MDEFYIVDEHQCIDGNLHLKTKKPIQLYYIDLKTKKPTQLHYIDDTEQPYDIELRGTTKGDMHLVAKEKTMENCRNGIYSMMENSHDRMKALLESHKRTHMPGIDKVIFNPPATIVMWNDGTKTIVKASDDSFSEEVGLCEAIAKRYFSNRSKLKKAVKDAKRPETGRN
jgi:hypothetical protein